MNILEGLIAILFFLTLNLKEFFNAVATEQITMSDCQTLLQSFGKKKLHQRTCFCYSLLFGEMAVMFLEGSKVSNEKLKNYWIYLWVWLMIGKSLSL